MQLPNLLNMALPLVGVQQFTYYRFASRITNDIGLDVAQYESGIILSGQVQAVPRYLYEVYGLDFQKNYVTFYVSKDVLDVTRDISGDQIKYADKIFQVLSENDWYPMNGWTGILSVQVDNAGQ